MKSYLGSLATVLMTGALVLGMSVGAGAQQGPPASQQPMEIPAQYPPQPQGGPQPQGPPQQAPQNDPGAARISFVRGDAPGDLFRELGNHNLVGINNQDPFIAEWQVIEGPVLLLGVRPVEMKLHHPCPMLRRHLGGAIAAESRPKSGGGMDIPLM